MKLVYSINLALLLCLLKANSDDLRCSGNHFYRGFILSDLLYRRYCEYESFGQSLSTAVCDLTEYHNSSAECRNLEFISGPLDGITDWVVRPYFYSQNIRLSNYNLTFTNVKWQYMRYRVRPVQQRALSYCAEMTLSPSAQVRVDTTLAFSCRLFDETMENRDVELQFSVGESPTHLQGGGLLYFRVPPADSIDLRRTPLERWQLLLLLQGPAEGSGPGQLALRWEPAPARLQVLSYWVRLLARSADAEELLAEREVEAAGCQGSCQVLLPLPQRSPVELYASVQLRDAGGRCAAWGPHACVSRSLLLTLDDPGSAMPPLLALLLVLLLVSVAIVFCCMCWLRCRPGPPTVLLLHQPVHAAHCRVVEALATVLHNACGAHCVFSTSQAAAGSDTDADSDSDGDRAGEGAGVDVVLVLASPAVQQQQLSWPHVPSASRYLLAVLPYCSPEAVPPSAPVQLPPPLLLPAQLPVLLWQLRPGPAMCVALLLPCLRPHLLGKAHHHLAEAWVAAQQMQQVQQLKQVPGGSGCELGPSVALAVGLPPTMACIDDYDLLGTGTGAEAEAGTEAGAAGAASTLDSWQL